MFFQSRKVKKIILEIERRVESEQWEGLEELFASIPETSSKEILANKYYWKAQFHQNKDGDNLLAEHYFRLIQEEWSVPIYALSLIELSDIYFNEKKYEDVIEILMKIPEHWDINLYSMACFRLGYTTYKLGKFNQAIDFWLQHLQYPDDNHNITHMWVAKAYKSLNNYEKFKEHINKITTNDNSSYSWGIIEIIVSECINNDDQELSLLEKIKEDSGDSYDYAQCMIGAIKYKKNLIDEAVVHWLSVKPESNLGYQIAQKKLLDVIHYYLHNGNYNSVENLLEHIKRLDLQYEVDILKSIYEISNCEESLFLLYLKVRSIKKLLQIKQDSNNIYCHKFAHYTSRSVAQMILGSQTTSGNLQLNVADLMNDPMEGKILHNILEQPEWLTSRFNHRKYQAYASCFSFNHDSLNQFRLYGKEEGKEATGVSMVFDLNMFSDDESSNISIVNPKFQKDKLKKIDDDDDDDDDDDNNVKFPLYQCVYFDPKSGYYKLACRAEMTFYRQGKIDGEELHEVKSKWGTYSNEIFRKENLLRELFEDLKRYLDNISQYVNSDIAENKKNKQKIINLINDILLPIQFLVKHAAFIEEDECRMLYIVGAGSDEIKEMKDKDGKSRLYIEYEPSVVRYLDKIYLSDGAKEERAFLERAWQKALDRDGVTDKSIDIRDSDNPFRI